ncbi:MAG: hypothetical protein WBG57_00405 [Ornithinimicrobium sp.]
MRETSSNREGRAQVLPLFPVRETPQTAEVDVEGQAVTVIYLPWQHEVDGEQRPAGVYYQASESAGFYPAPTDEDLDVLLEDLVPHLRRQLHVVPDVDRTTST